MPVGAFELGLEAVLADVLDERVERADDADLGRAAVLGDEVHEVVADLAAGIGVVDADLGLLRAFGQDRVDGDDGNAGLVGLDDRRHDAVHVDGHDDDAVDALGDVGLDRAVLRGGIVVGVEDQQLGAGGVGGGLGALVHLVEEQGLLVDLDEREGLGVLRGGGAGEADEGGSGEGEREASCQSHGDLHPLVGSFFS